MSVVQVEADVAAGLFIKLRISCEAPQKRRQQVPEHAMGMVRRHERC